jgi:uncharacterized membrane protein YeiH
VILAQLVDPAAPGTGFETIERALELIGLFTFAISGAMLAVRKNYEIVGVASLAMVTALGGGIMRDLVLGDSPPRAFQDAWYPTVALAAAVVVFGAHHLIDGLLQRSVLVFDAVGLGLFSVTGAVKAAAYDTTAIGVVLLAVVTAIGGGIMRDVLANDQPQIFQSESRLYAIPAAIGAVIVVVSVRNGVYSGSLAAAIAAGICATRLAALRWGWRAPRPRPARRR